MAARKDIESTIASAAAAGFREELNHRLFAQSPEIAAITAQFHKAAASIDVAAPEMRQVAKAPTPDAPQFG